MRRLRSPAMLALVCLGLAYASLAQGIGWNQLAHYSLVRALAVAGAAVATVLARSVRVALPHGS